MVTEEPVPKIGANGTTPAATKLPARVGRKRGRMPKWLVWVIIGSLIGLGWLYWRHVLANQNSTGNMITVKVTRGDLSESVSATGSVTAQTGFQINIGSQITGVIKNLYADVGSQVKAGQLIARLDLPDLLAEVVTARAALSAAKTKLAQEEAGVGMTDTQVRMAVTSAEAGLESAQAKLRSAQATASQAIVQTPTDLLKAETALASAQAALTTARAALVQTEAGADLLIATAQNQYTQALAVSVNSTLDLSRQQTLAKKGYVAQNVADLAKATAVSNLALVSSAQKNILLVQQKATADLETAHDTVAQAIQNVAAAQDALIAARAESYTVQAQIANVQDSVDAQRQAVAIHEIAIGNLTQILQYQQDVQQAQEAVQEAVGQVSFNQADYNKSYIRSPITGTVLQMTAQQGETVAAGLAAPTLIIVANLHKLQIDAFVDETDIAAVRLGQPAQIVLDAFPKHVFTGIVSKISAGSTIQNGVVTYDVTAAIHQEPAYALKPDMTATVVIVTGHRHNVLLLPSVAIQVGVKGSTVNLMIQQNGKTVVQSVPVMTGGTDGTNTEVTSGLTEGQTVIEAGAPPVTTGSGGTAHSSSPFSAPSHGGGGGVGGRRG